LVKKNIRKESYVVVAGSRIIKTIKKKRPRFGVFFKKEKRETTKTKEGRKRQPW